MRPVTAVLFVCGMNTVRSVMAQALLHYFKGNKMYVASAGVRKGTPDPFVDAAMEELGLKTTKHRPQTLEELEDMEGLNFDLIITLSPEAHHKVLDLTRTIAAEIEYWPTPDPSLETGNREQRLEAYRQIRDQLRKKIITRFMETHLSNE